MDSVEEIALKEKPHYYMRHQHTLEIGTMQDLEKIADKVGALL